MLPPLALLLLPSGAFWIRNTAVFGSPLGVTRNAECFDPYQNAERSPGVFASNLLRNIGLHLGTASPERIRRVQTSLASLAAQSNVDLEAPAATWPGTHLEVPLAQHHEATEPNLLHLVLLSAALLAGLLFGQPPLRNLCLALVAGYLCICLLLRWQPWHTRRHLPFFLLWPPPSPGC